NLRRRVARQGAVKGKITLRALENGSVQHDARVAHCAGEDANFYRSLFRNYIAIERNRPILGYWGADVLMPGRIAQVEVIPRNGDAAIGEGTVKDYFTCLDPVLVRFER